MPKTFESCLARCLAAMAVAAPVRLAVIHVQSITLMGKPVSVSFKMSSPDMYGKPCLGFSGKPLTHLMPADFIPGMYAGMAWMKASF